ncbi:MAG: glycosyltransferase [Alistipes sp.]
MNLLDIIDSVLFVALAFAVCYLFLFAVAALPRRKESYPCAKKQVRFLTLIPAYKGDSVVESAIRSALGQAYPADLQTVVVIADHFRPETLTRLAHDYPSVRLLAVNFEESSKAKAMQYAVEQMGREAADVVVILDVDNIAAPDCLQLFNDAYASGIEAIQAHRSALNRDTDTAVLDAVSEEINNSIFRRGHTALGLSSALIGSGMAFKYSWFCDHIGRCVTAGEDKELEAMLLHERIYIDYLETAIVLDEKVQKEGAFYNQRRRWLAAQVGALVRGVRDLPAALVSGNWDYADKLIQWMLPPRVLLLGFLLLFALLTSFLIPAWSIKWWALLLMLAFALAFATPDEQVDKRLRRALQRVPVLFLLMTANLFRLRGAGRKFIHTQHKES